MNTDTEFDAVPPAAHLEDVPEGDSLAARMAQRAEGLEKQRTEWFPIPGYEKLLEVELRSVGFRKARKVVNANSRERDEATAELYSMCDNLMAGTVGFRECIGGDRYRELPGETWRSLAQRLPACPDNVSQRQALLFLLGEDRIMFLLEEWTEWQRNIGKEIAEEVVEDFGQTG